jgi:hypothetical protein
MRRLERRNAFDLSMKNGTVPCIWEWVWRGLTLMPVRFVGNAGISEILTVSIPVMTKRR